MKSPAFVLTITNGRNVNKEIWHSSTPLPIGRPFRWIVENSSKGPVVRELTPPSKTAVKPRIFAVTPEMIKSGKSIHLPSGQKISFKAADLMQPAYEAVETSLDRFQVFAFRKAQVTGSALLNGTYKAMANGECKFTAVGVNAAVEITCQSDDLLLVSGRRNNLARRGEKLIFKPSELLGMIFKCGDANWVFHGLPSDGYVERVKIPESIETINFRKNLLATGAGSFLILCLLLVLPKPQKTEELIPAQYAKILMKPQTQSGAKTNSSSPSQDKNVAQARKTSVVQAFRSSSLKSAASSLLRGGMTKLLQQSDFVMGSAASDKARRILDTKSQSLVASAQSVGALSQNQKVEVASMGGAAHGSGAKGAVGYAKGEHAGIKGQGHSLVKIDSAGSSVDEGLSRDEVGAVIHKHMSEIRYCYEASMLRHPSIEGKLVLAFTISGIGSVKEVEVRASTLPDPGLDDCISRRLRGWQFPRTRGGVDVAVTYPFIFKSLGG